MTMPYNCYIILLISSVLIFSTGLSAVVCDELNLQNGRVELTDAYRAGSVATHTCDNGFTLNGDQVRTCQSSGAWTGSVASCMEGETTLWLR